MLRCRHNIPGQKAATQMGCIPDRDLRRKQADHPDAQGVQPPGPVCDLSVQQNERGAKCKVVLRCAALFPDRVGADDGKAGSSNAAVKEVQTIVELVVPQRCRVVSQRIHGGDHRMRGTDRKPMNLGGVVAQRAALKKIAIVEQKRIGRVGAQVCDQRCGTAKPERFPGPIREIVVGKDLGVNIRGRHDPDMGLVARGDKRIMALEGHLGLGLQHWRKGKCRICLCQVVCTKRVNVIIVWVVFATVGDSWLP